MSKKDEFEKKNFFPFNDAALRNENARIARGGCHAPWVPGEKTIFEILESLAKQKDALADIFCPDDKKEGP